MTKFHTNASCCCNDKLYYERFFRDIHNFNQL